MAASGAELDRMPRALGGTFLFELGPSPAPCRTTLPPAPSPVTSARAAPLCRLSRSPSSSQSLSRPESSVNQLCTHHLEPHMCIPLLPWLPRVPRQTQSCHYPDWNPGPAGLNCWWGFHPHLPCVAPHLLFLHLHRRCLLDVAPHPCLLHLLWLFHHHRSHHLRSAHRAIYLTNI